jgi:hypothetical protein
VNGIADIRGISKRVLAAFSHRSREIDAYLRSRREGTPVSFVRSLRDGLLFPSVGRPPARTPATADRHPGVNGWLSSWGTTGEMAGCPPPRTLGA